jgi:hypothetical protein
MELADRFQALEPLDKAICKISKQRVDKLLQVVALTGACRDKVVENLIVAPGVELGF